MSTNFSLFCVYTISLIGLLHFSTTSFISAQPNLAIPDAFSLIQSNMSTPNTQPNMSTPNTVISNQQTEETTTSSSITETVNEVLSGSIDGMIGDTVDMLNSNSGNSDATSDKSSLDNEIPSSLTLEKNNQTIVRDTPETKTIGNTSNNTQNISKVLQPNNQSSQNSVDQIKQSFQKSMYNSTITQSFDNNSFTKLADQNTFDNLIYKMQNILETDLFK